MIWNGLVIPSPPTDGRNARHGADRGKYRAADRLYIDAKIILNIARGSLSPKVRVTQFGYRVAMALHGGLRTAVAA